MKSLSFITTFLISCSLQAQFFVNSGGILEIGTGAILTIQNMDAENQGEINHAGDIEVTGNIANSGLWVCNSFNKSRITLSLNWTNNSSFNPGIGNVEFNGTDQTIGGMNESNFYNLKLLGVVGYTKRLLTNASCMDSLYLDNIELATAGNRFSIRNASIPVKRSKGFISTSNHGTVRVFFPTTITGNREIPLGFGIGTSMYKPVFTINPSNDSFDLRLYGNSPTADGRTSYSLQDSLCSINEKYYYNFVTYGSNFFYGINRNSSEDIYSKLGRWNGLKWDKISSSAQTALLPTQNLAYNSQAPASIEYVSQAQERPFVDAGADVGLFPGANIKLNPTGYFPAGSTFNWEPGTDLSCTDCPDPEIYVLAQPGIYTITVSNGPNCEASDTLNVTQTGEYTNFIANAFSPNGDRINDEFGPVLFPGDKLAKMEIFNRWGEKIYKGTENWDGYYQGTPVSQGVYTYTIYITRPSGRRHFNLSGTITVLR